MEKLWIDEMADDQLLETMDLLNSSSDEEMRRKHGGSVPGRARNIERGREEAAERLYHDYFSSTPVYSSTHFERRFRITRSIFMRIAAALEVHDPYFTQRIDCTGRKGLTSQQNLTAALRLLAYSSTADSVDEYVRIGESTALECLDKFCGGVLVCFGEEYLRAPTEEDLLKILARSEKRGFPGMIGSIDCAKWVWKNCPTAHHGQYQGKEVVPAMTIECIADDQLWIWHMFFGMPGSANDINVLESSTLSNKIANGTYPLPIQCEIGGETRSVPYWLADGIYPNWPCFFQIVSHPVSTKETVLATSQEAARKDVERAFGVLQAKWHIISRPSRFWYKRKMKTIMKCCVILHNTMVEHRMELGETEETQPATEMGVTVPEEGRPMWVTDVGDYDVVPPYGSIAAMCALARFTNNHSEYFVTRELVMNHLWARKGDE